MKNHHQIVWHALKINDVISELKSNETFGLSQTEAKQRLKEFGLNSLPQTKCRSIVSIFFHQFISPLMYILLIAIAIA